MKDYNFLREETQHKMQAEVKINDESEEKFEKLEEIGELEELEPIDLPEEIPSVQPAPTARRKKSRRLPPLLRLTRRSVVFLSLTLIATIIFFVTGNKQTFLDSNLNMILKIIACTAIALSIFSTAGAVECVFYTFKDKKIRLVFHLVSYTIVFALSVVISILSLTINLLSEGIDF